MSQEPRRRIFVLDTNVLMHDPTAIFRFDEHDIFLPMVVLEELDTKALKAVAASAREAITTRIAIRFFFMIAISFIIGLSAGVQALAARRLGEGAVAARVVAEERERDEHLRRVGDPRAGPFVTHPGRTGHQVGKRCGEQFGVVAMRHRCTVAASECGIRTHC